MTRAIVGGVTGAVLGGILFFPPAVPLTFSILFALVEQGQEVAIPTAIDFVFSLFWILPLIGIVLGGIVGSLVGRYRVYRVPAKSWTLSLFLGSTIVFWLLGVEVGFLLSPVTMIGLGNTSTWMDLWIFSVLIGGIGFSIGFVIGLLLIGARFVSQKIAVLGQVGDRGSKVG